MVVQVNTDDLHQLAADFSTASGNVQPLLSSFNSISYIGAKRLIGSDKAAGSYSQIHSQSVQSINQIVTSLACISQKLTLAADAYDQVQTKALRREGS